jgi:aspartate/methionine/tyrosine aminotransferase
LAAKKSITTTMLGLIGSGNEVIIFSPFYDSFQVTLFMSDAKINTVTSIPPDFVVPEKEQGDFLREHPGHSH